MHQSRFFRIGAVWAAALMLIGALHVQLNRGGFMQAIRSSRHRAQLTVGHLPVT